MKTKEELLKELKLEEMDADARPFLEVLIDIRDRLADNSIPQQKETEWEARERTSEVPFNQCEISGQYGKDNNKELHFYCEFCGEEMEHDEKRICKSKSSPKQSVEWEEEFDEKFYFLVDNNDKHKEKEIKSFISSLLLSVRNATLKEAVGVVDNEPIPDTEQAIAKMWRKLKQYMTLSMAYKHAEIIEVRDIDNNPH